MPRSEPSRPRFPQPETMTSPAIELNSPSIQFHVIDNGAPRSVLPPLLQEWTSDATTKVKIVSSLFKYKHRLACRTIALQSKPVV